MEPVPHSAYPRCQRQTKAGAQVPGIAVSRSVRLPRHFQIFLGIRALVRCLQLRHRFLFHLPVLSATLGFFILVRVPCLRLFVAALGKRITYGCTVIGGCRSSAAPGSIGIFSLPGPHRT